MGRDDGLFDNDCEWPCVGRNVGDGDVDRSDVLAIRIARLVSAS